MSVHACSYWFFLLKFICSLLLYVLRSFILINIYEIYHEALHQVDCSKVFKALFMSLNNIERSPISLIHQAYISIYTTLTLLSSTEHNVLFSASHKLKSAFKSFQKLLCRLYINFGKLDLFWTGFYVLQ